VRSLVARETAKNFITGFLTGCGGLWTLPVAVPAALGTAWAIQARMAATIGILHGHDVGKERVRTVVLLSLVGDAGTGALRRAGTRVEQRMAQKTIQQIPASVLVELNKKLGMRWASRGAGKGLLNLSKAIPFVGGMVGGAFDAVACRTVGRIAHESFRQQESPSSETGPAATWAEAGPRRAGENGSSMRGVEG